MSGLEEIKQKLSTFKRRFYIRQVIIGIIGFLIVNSVAFLLSSGLEHQFWLGVTGRTVLFFGFLVLILTSFYFLILKPVLKLLNLSNGLTDEEAALEIANHFQEIEDKLINTLQLSSNEGNELIAAAIETKSKTLNRLSFVQAVDFKPVRKYMAILLIVAIGFSMVSFINPAILSDSPGRIVNFKKEFIPDAPFRFLILNEELKGYRGEDFSLQVQLDGMEVPEFARIYIDGENSAKSFNLSNNGFSYTFSKLQNDREFQIEAAGFRSQTFMLKVNERPDLVSMLIQVNEPAYTGGQSRTIENTGDLTVLEGSSVLWDITAVASDSASFVVNDNRNSMTRTSETQFRFEEKIVEGGGYKIDLFNQFGKNKSELAYSIEVIKDEYPKIVAEYIPDSVTYQSITFTGSVSDDYGFSGLVINFRISGNSSYDRIPLEIKTSAGNQSYFAHWSLDSLKLEPAESLEVYLSVLDNDQIRGPKETKAGTFILKAPTPEEISSMISEKEEGVEEQLDDSQNKAEDIAERLEALEEKLKSEQKFDWQEKKILDDVIEDREKLTKGIEKLQEQYDELLKANEKFREQSPQLKEKNRQNAAVT